MANITVELVDSEKTLELPEEITLQDQMLKDALRDYYPAVADSEIKRIMRGKTPVIQIVENVKPKGVQSDVLNFLRAAPSSINPAHQVYLKLLNLQQGNIHLDPHALIEMQDEIDAAYIAGQRELTDYQEAVEALSNAFPIPSQTVPCGF